MDSAARPQSIVGPACQALISTVHQVAADVTNFVRRCRSARTDLAPITRELSELQMVLQLLNDFEEQRGAVPEELQTHLRPIIANCIGVVCKVHEVLRRQEVAGWTVGARDEVSELGKSLGVHRGVMGVVADIVSVLAWRAEAGEDGSGNEHAQITALLEELQALGSSLVISYSNATLAREHFALQVHLGQIVNFTETLARTDLWQDAVRTLDEAQQVGRGLGDQQRQLDVQRSVAQSSPSGRSNSRLETALSLDSRETYDKNRPARMFFTPKRPSEPEPLAEIESAGPSGTGFIVMDGFGNSTQGVTMTSPMVPYYGRVHPTSPQHLTVPGSEPRISQRSIEDASSSDLAIKCTTAQRLQSTTPTDQESASGLQVQISDEKELAENVVVSDEALAFAQVPIHVLDRLSVNLVGKVYGGSPLIAEDKTSATQSHSVPRTLANEDVWERGDVASASISGACGLRDGHLQSAQIDVSKIPATTAPTLHPNPISLPPSRCQTPLGQHHHHHHHQSSPNPSISAFPAASQATDTSTAMDSPRPSFTSPQWSPHFRPPSSKSSSASAVNSGLREMTSSSTIKSTHAQSYMSQKPLPRAPIVYIPDYPGPFIKKKVVVVGNFSCGKTSLLTRIARGQFPRSKADELRITETVKLSVDEAPIQLCFWDIRGIDYDPSWLHGAHVALVCFSVNIVSTDSKGKHLGRWVTEVNRNCPGAAILLVGLKSDIRFHTKYVGKLARRGKALVTPEQGEQFRENIGATRYVECSARTGEGVHDVLAETARVAIQVGSGRRDVRKGSSGGGGWRPLSRIGKFFGMGQVGDG